MNGEDSIDVDPQRVETIYPLTLKQRLFLSQQIPGYTWPERRWKDAPDPRKVIFVFWRTGMHPAVLAEPARFHLIASEGVVKWNRPKTDARAVIDYHDDIRDWIEGFLGTLKPRVGAVYDAGLKENGKPKAPHRMAYQFYTDMVKQVGREIGLPGMTPRTLRHTFLADLYDATQDLRMTSDLSGTSVQVVYNYVRTLRTYKPKVITAGKWGQDYAARIAEFEGPTAVA